MIVLLLHDMCFGRRITTPHVHAPFRLATSNSPGMFDLFCSEGDGSKEGIGVGLTMPMHSNAGRWRIGLALEAECLRTSRTTWYRFRRTDRLALAVVTANDA